MENVARVTGHIAARLRREGAGDVERRVLALVPTAEGEPFLEDQGEVWRLYRFVEGTRSLGHARSPADAFETGRAFGRFQRLLSDYAGARLHDTIPRFHDTPRRMAHLARAADEDAAGRAAAARGEIEALLDRRRLASALLDAQARGEIPERIVHNDAKITNVLFDAESGEGLCVVDLDTVMPGLSLYDFGDMVRTLTSGTDEDERDLEAVGVRPELFEALTRGFLEVAGEVLEPAERALLVRSAQVITLEQAARFLADHLEGDRYYRIERQGHNLDRARAQLRLLLSLEQQQGRLEAVSAALPPGLGP
jgi:Ser/Thr protein kinase RdoA (MazF antagonist)